MKARFLLLFLFLLPACNSLDICYYGDDFGETGNQDNIQIFSVEQMCYYNPVLSNNDESQSLTVRTCLKSLTVAGALSADETNFNDFIDGFLPDPADANTVKSRISGDSQCTSIDPVANDITSSDGIIYTAARELYDKCYNYCVDQCSGNSSGDSSKWVKASIKTTGAFLGIKMTDTSYITINVTGTIVLTATGEAKSGSFNKIGTKDYSYKAVIDPSSAFNLNLQYVKDTVNSKFGNIYNLQARTVLELKNVETSVVDSSADGEEKYRFQDISYSYLKCDIEDKTNIGFNSALCKFNFADVENITTDLRNSLNFLYNKDNYMVFTDGYYNYDASNLNYVSYMVENAETGLMEPYISKDDVKLPDTLSLSTDGMEILYNEYNGGVAGYVWNYEGNMFDIETNYAAKVAIRYIGNEAATCILKASTDTYIDNISDAGTATENVQIDTVTKTYGPMTFNFTPATQNSNKNVWQVLKTDVGAQGSGKTAEIVFNQFSTPVKEVNSVISLELQEGSSEACSKGLLIKLIPLKDYVVEKSGLLFFYIPNYNTSVQLKYTLINPELPYRNFTSLKDQMVKLEEFYDGSTNYHSFGLNEQYAYDTVNTVIPSEVSGKIDKDNYNDLLSKAIFAREGQVIRFDYSNWIDIDGRENMSKKMIQIGDKSNVDLPVSLTVITKEKYPFFCAGKAQETVDYEDYCTNNNQEYDLINVTSCEKLVLPYENTASTSCSTSSGYFGRCEASISSCLTDEELAKTYNQIIMGSSIDLSQLSGEALIVVQQQFDEMAKSYIGQTLAKTFANIFNAYKQKEEQKLGVFNTEKPGYHLFSSVVSNEDDRNYNGDIQNYMIVVNTIYEQAKKCLNDIKSKSTLTGKDGILYYGSNGAGQLIKREIPSESALLTNQNTTLLNNNDIFYNYNTIGSSQAYVKEQFDDAYDSFLKQLLDLKGFFAVESDDGSLTESFYTYSNYGDTLSEEKSQCYDLSSFYGSTERFLKDTLSNTNLSSDYVLSNGTMTENHKAIGAAKLGLFSAVNPGSITNFVSDNTFDSFDTTRCKDASKCAVIKYSDALSASNDFTPAVTILNFIENTSGLQNISNYFKTTEESSDIFFFSEQILSYNKNGERLAMFIGEDGNSYYGSSDGITEVKVVNDNTGVSGAIATNASSNNFNFDSCTGNNTYCFYPLVYYSGEELISPYTFNEEGLFISASNGDSSGLNIAGDTNMQNYIRSNNNSQKNLFFKIIDRDNNSENNDGSYSVTIKEYVNDEGNNIIDIFRKFFRTVLSFVDGNYISIMQIGDSLENVADRFVNCEESESDTDVSCYIYSDLNPEHNGEMCNPGDINCFIGCLDTVTADGENGCFVFSDGTGFVKELYKTLITNPLYILLLKLLLILSIAFYGFGYFFGMTSFKQSEIIEKLIKIAFIYFMAGPNGWEFFDKYIATFFKDGIDSILFLIAGSFETNMSSTLMQAVATGDYSDKVQLFSGAFDNLEMIFSNAVFSKILGLTFSGFVGPIYLYFVLTTILTYMVAVVTSIVLYLSAQVYMSLIFCFFPLVLIFMFFKKTDDTFKNWLSLLIGFAGQQIFLVTTLSFFNMLIYNLIRNTFNYTVCFLPLFNFTVGGFLLGIIRFYKIPNTGLTTTGLNTGGEAMPSFYSILTFYMVGILMSKFITSMTSLGNSIFGGKMEASQGAAGQLIGSMNRLSGSATNFMKNTVVGAYKGVARKAFNADYIDEKGTKRIKEKAARDEKFKTEQNKRTEERFNKFKKSKECERSDKEIARKVGEDILSKSNSAEDKAFMDSYKKTLESGDEERATAMMVTHLNNTGRGKEFDVATRKQQHKRDREVKNRIQNQVTNEMLSEVDDAGNPTEFNMVSQLNERDAEAYKSLTDEQKKEINNKYIANNGLSAKLTNEFGLAPKEGDGGKETTERNDNDDAYDGPADDNPDDNSGNDNPAPNPDKGKS